MAFTFEQLTEPKTQKEVLVELKKFLEDLGIQTTNWKPRSPSQTNLQLDAYIYKQLLDRIASQSFNQLNQYASGSALSELSISRFQNERILADKTRGYMNVSSSALIQPRTWLPGELKVADPGNNQLVFLNMETITVSSADAESLYKFEAQEAGESYNIQTGVTMSNVVTMNGLRVTNPVFGTNSDTWITDPGVNMESDNALRSRNETKFASLQRGESISKGIEHIIYEANQMEFVRCDDTNPRGPGSVDVYIANALTTGTSTQVDVAQDALNLNSFNNTNYQSDSSAYRVQAFAAPALPWNRAIQVWVSPTFPYQELKEAIAKVMDDLVSITPIGGFKYSINGGIVPSDNRLHHLPYSLVVDRLMNVEGVKMVNASDTSDIDLGPFRKLTRPADHTIYQWDSFIELEQMDSSTFSFQ